MEAVPVSKLGSGFLLVAILTVQIGDGSAGDSGWRVASVKVVGARVRVPIRVGDSVTVGVLESTGVVVRQDLIDRGWLWSVVRWDTVHERNGLHVAFVIKPGSRARVARWRIEGNFSHDVVRVAQVLPRRGVCFSRHTAELALRALSDFYEANGFPFAAVQAGAMVESLGWVVPTLLVEEGPRVVVDFLEFEGQTVVSSSLLRRAARFRQGKLFSPGVIGQWRRNLERVGWLRCDSQALVVEDNRYGVRFWISELAFNRLSGSIGYSSAEGIVGFAWLCLQNLLNTGRRLNASWHARSALRGYELSYTEPWLFGSNVSATGKVSHTVYDTTMVSTDAELTGTVMTGNTGLGLVSGWQRITSRIATGNISTSWAGTIFDFDARDGFPFPTKGVSTVVKVGAGQRRGYHRHTSAVGRLATGVHYLVPVGERLVWSTTVEVRAVFCRETLTAPELYSLGGAKGLRGFSEDAFLTPAAVWSNWEFRYTAAHNVRMYPFVDIGVCRQREEGHLVAAYGVGLSWLNRLGVLVLDYGVGVGRDLLDGKVHLRLEGGF